MACQYSNAGHEVIGATSSEEIGSIDNIYFSKETLPHITDVQFLMSVSSLISRLEIDALFTNVKSVYYRLKNNLTIPLLSCDPLDAALQPIRILELEIGHRQDFINKLCAQFNQESIDPSFLTSVLFNTLSVPGESHIDKLIAILCIFQTIPENADIVEIGTLYGRTSFLFCLLSKEYKKGQVLAIDPWPSEGVDQGTTSFLDQLNTNTDSNDFFHYFINKTRSLFKSNFNYIKDFSRDAVKTYNTKSIQTTEFGAAHYNGNIALLHIDGNHKYEDVSADIEIWASQLYRAAWIIIDDYNWPYGNGPKRAADEFLVEHWSRIDFAFYCGGALFVRIE